MNAPPAFDDLAGLEVLEGETIDFRAFAFDADNPGVIPQDRTSDGSLTAREGSDPTVTYTVSGLPAGAAFDTDTAVFRWTPSYAAAGTYTVLFTATDNGDGTGTPAVTTIAVPIVVRNANRAPVIAEITNQSVARGESIDVALGLADPDGNPYTLATEGLPRFASIVTLGDGSRVLRIAPGAQDRGDYVVKLTVTDDGDGGGAKSVLSTSRTFVVTALSPSEAPVLQPIGSKVAVIGQPLTFTVRASDLDQDPLAFTTVGLPSGATLTPGAAYGTAVFHWTPQAADAGTHDITIRVTDDGNNGAGTIGSDERIVRVVVRATNQAPVLAPIGDQQAQEGQPFALQLAATDPDGDPLIHSVVDQNTLPPGARFDAETGRLEWTPGFLQAGRYEGIVLGVSDGASTVTETFAIVVAAVNRAPLLSSVAPIGGQEAAVLHFSLTSTDPDGELARAPTVSSSTAPRAASRGPRTTVRPAATRSRSRRVTPPARPTRST